MTINITRWSPDTCGCTIEVGWDDQEPQDTRVGKFVLLSTVCDKHKPLATTTHRADHQQLTKIPLGHIEDAKRINLADPIAKLAESQWSPRRMKEARQNHSAVLKFNQDLDEEWAELVAQPHAFDAHIYDAVLKENQTKNSVST